MQYFAGKQILSGQGYCGWESNFWPPLYSFLTGFLSVAINGFWSAKIISVVSACILVLLTYNLSFELFLSKRVSLVSQYLVAFNPFFFLSSIQAENHMLDSLFFVSGLLVYLRALRKDGIHPFWVSGALFGLAGLTRYTSYSFIPIALIVPFVVNRRTSERPMLAGLLFISAFAIVSSPWWVYNTLVNGSPLHTWQYLNIGSSALKYNGISPDVWWWKEMASYDSISQIISSSPLSYIKNFASNVKQSIFFLITSAGVLAPFFVPGVFGALLHLRGRIVITLLPAMALFVAIVSQAFVFRDVFLPWAIVLVPVSVWWIDHYMARICKRLNLSGIRVIRFSFIAMILLSLFFAIRSARAYTLDTDDGGQLSDLQQVTTVLKRDDHISDKYVMSIHPARAYYSGSKYMMIPLHYTGSVSGLPSYKELDSKVADFSPRYPNSCSEEQVPKADYLVFDKPALGELPEFSFLFNKGSRLIPPNFKRVYQSDGTVVFKIVS